MQQVAFVGLDALLPKRLGNDAEHGAAVEFVGAVGENDEFVVAQRQSVQGQLLGCRAEFHHTEAGQKPAVISEWCSDVER